MTSRSKLIWLVCSLVGLCSVALMRKPTVVHQGDGAKLLLTKPKAVPSTAGLMPNIVVVPPRPVTFWFTLRSYSYGPPCGVSDPSSPMDFERTNHENTVTLGWDNVLVDGYYIQWGQLAGATTNLVDVGNVTKATIQIVPPPLTNVCITVSGSTNWTMTNPPASSMFFTGQHLTISKRYF